MIGAPQDVPTRTSTITQFVVLHRPFGSRHRSTDGGFVDFADLIR
jgi:hypothetical protein